MPEFHIAASPRTDFGKGPARRERRAGRVPAVLYGHGTEPRHISLPGHEVLLALRTANVLIRLEGLSGGSQLALPKAVQRDAIKGFLEHVDLLLVKRGEKVTVEVPVQTEGELAPGVGGRKRQPRGPFLPYSGRPRGMGSPRWRSQAPAWRLVYPSRPPGRSAQRLRRMARTLLSSPNLRIWEKGHRYGGAS